MSKFSQHIADSELSLLAESSKSIKTHNLVLIDSKVKDLDQLITGVKPNTSVYVLHPQENGIEQITAILQQHPQLETVYLVAHGEPGCLYLGNNIVTEETLSKVGESLKSWKIEQLLIYACNVAAGLKGEAFLQRLHQLTKAKIAAASYGIGQTEFGQNWQLDKTTHPIEIKSVFNAEVMTTYSGVLAAGDLDTSFGGGDGIATFGGGASIESIAVQPDGKIVAVGSAGNNFAVLRFNSNGTPDTTFGGNNNGAILINFWGNDYADSVAVQPDGKIVVAGNSDDNFAVVRIAADGKSFDSSFGSQGIIKMDLGGYDSIQDMVLQPDGKIVVVGGSSIDYDTNKFAVVRYNSNGSLDTTFSGDGIDLTNLGEEAYAVALQPDGKIIVAGESDRNPYTRFVVARYNSNGSFDNTFNGDGVLNTSLGGDTNRPCSIAVQPDGKIIVGGWTGYSGQQRDFAIARYTSNGSLDTTFNENGQLTTSFGDDDRMADLALQPDGKIITTGFSGNYQYDPQQGVVYFSPKLVIARYTNNGNLDTTFSGDGKVLPNGFKYASSVALQADGKILIAGSNSTEHQILRYQNNITSSTINGTANNDILTGTANPETIKGLGGNDKLSGLAGNDSLNGGDGVDTLDGSAGNDTLTGGNGVDKFIYNTNAVFTTSAVGVDTIADFTIAQGDKIVLDKTTFPKISSVAGTGFSVDSEFAKVNSDALAATSAADIVYNSATGALFYNQNGTAAGFGTGAKFLTLTNKPVLTENQFLIQA